MMRGGDAFGTNRYNAHPVYFELHDQLLQLVMVCLDDIVQVLDRSMHRFLWTFAFSFELCYRDSVGVGPC